MHARRVRSPLRQHRPATRQQGGRPQGLTKGPSDVFDHATSEIASGSKLGIDATKKLPGEGFKRPWPPLIKMDAAVKAKVEKILKNPAIFPPPEVMSKLEFLEDLGAKARLYDEVWTAVKAK